MRSSIWNVARSQYGLFVVGPTSVGGTWYCPVFFLILTDSLHTLLRSGDKGCWLRKPTGAGRSANMIQIRTTLKPSSGARYPFQQETIS
jgi:hypothetical protein